MNKSTTILAIETSCDETGLAVVQKSGGEIKVLSQALASQIDIHKETGGVVPEVAAREHTKVLRPLLQKVLKEARGGLPREARASERSGVDALAVTIGPGLIPALAVGVTAARTLAYVWNKPIVPVHHIEGHIYSALCAEKAQSPKHKIQINSKSQTNSKFQIPDSKNFPILALIVSGGHTMLIEMQEHLRYSILGETRDDAAGEAFDKVARLLDLPYPGGPALSKLAEQGNSKAFDFPRPMMHSKDLDFSFSGLKTAVLYALRDHPEVSKQNIAASFQQAVIDSLVGKTVQAFDQLSPKVVLLAGGVAANSLLRAELKKSVESRGGELRIAPLSLCGDNAVMISQAGLVAFDAGRKISWKDVDAQARISITGAGRWG